LTVGRLEYLERFLCAADFVASGRKGAMSGDRWLIGNYDPSFYGVLEKYLRCEDERIRAETVSLLAAVRERAALPEIRRMRAREGERVAMACLGYLSAAEESDSLIPELFDILEHKRGAEFERAAVRMRSAGRSEDVPRLRRIYGQVEGGMRDSLRRALESIADRDETLRGKKDLILSVPVYPDREAFSSFLERSIDYLDVRYRGNVHPLRTVEKGTYNNVARALRVMRVRLYNEYDNLGIYGPEEKEGYDELAGLVVWASEDLRGKRTAEGGRGQKDRRCPRCGGPTVTYKGLISCPECGSCD